MTDRSCDTAAWKGRVASGRRCRLMTEKPPQSAAGAAPPIGERGERRAYLSLAPRQSDAQLHIVRDNKSCVLLKCDQHFFRPRRQPRSHPKAAEVKRVRSGLQHLCHMCQWKPQSGPSRPGRTLDSREETEASSVTSFGDFGFESLDVIFWGTVKD